MIVWGGDGVSGDLMTGGRYDPGADSWIATTTINAPSARTYNTAVWTGSEMIVWGGSHSSFLNTGGRYCGKYPPPTPTPSPTPLIVTNTNDSGPGSLRQALLDANDDDTIEFAVTGVIVLTSGELLINKSITVAGPGAGKLAIDGNATHRVFRVGPAKTVTISGLTIFRGNACCTFPDDLGGAIYNDHSALTVNNCTINNNMADTSGAGIYSDGSNGSATVVITDTLFVENSAFSGGAIFNNGESGTAIVEITRSSLHYNAATAAGGGIFNDHGHVTVNYCEMDGNSAGGNGGGGIYNRGTFGHATVDVEESTFFENSAQSLEVAFITSCKWGSPAMWWSTSRTASSPRRHRVKTSSMMEVRSPHSVIISAPTMAEVSLQDPATRLTPIHCLKTSDTTVVRP
jgi:Chlamydia polymorphic membrane protein (Chlamydia_PMP) repeat